MNPFPVTDTSTPRLPDTLRPGTSPHIITLPAPALLHLPSPPTAAALLRSSLDSARPPASLVDALPSLTTSTSTPVSQPPHVPETTAAFSLHVSFSLSIPLAML